jgi:mucin-like protein
VSWSYNGCLDPWWAGEQCDANVRDCSNRCNNASASVGSQSFANSLCAKGIPNGTVLKARSHIGTLGPQTNNTIGTLTNIPAVSNTVCTCPAPWSNANNVVGGTTTGLDTNCKIAVCGPITPGPGTSLPPNGTSTNTSPNWWTWGNGLVETAPVANCVTTPISVARCGFGLGPGTWTAWFNRDNKPLDDDIESLKDLVGSNQVCAHPLAIECQTVSGTDWSKTQLVYHCDLSKGGSCINKEQTTRQICDDFKVRYLCP